MSIFTADAWRSFVVILIGVALVYAYSVGKLKPKTTIALITLLCLVDMWGVNKRYLYDEQFVAQSNKMKPYLQPSETDKEILKDKSLDYRVLNLAANTFNENNTAYWHKSIGGYHAAKLRRYQEMIEEHIQGEMSGVFSKLSEANGDMAKVDANAFPVLNMLNTRYFILPLQGGKTAPVFNPHAYGNAWFVDNVEYVDNANEEIDALHDINPRHTAVVDKRFAEQVRASSVADSLDTVVLKEYQPNALKYEVNSKNGGVVVFSEIYYPGWISTIDGEEVEHGRADYILRAMNVPAGKHVVEFKFDPKSLHLTETIAYIALVLLAVGAVVVIATEYRRRNS